MNNSCEAEKKTRTLKEWLRSAKFWKPVLAVTIGGTLGFAYYHFEGCASGTCTITSSPILSTVFGGVMGLFFINRPCRSC
ncbi:MAG: DUF6132 family protein [Bacteroidota bacterium]